MGGLFTQHPGEGSKGFPREMRGQCQELRKKELPLLTNGVNKGTTQQFSHREMRHDYRESTFKTRKDKAESLMELREGRVRESKKESVLRNSGQETGSWGRIHKRAAKKEALPGGRCVFCSGPHAAQDLRIWVGRPLALWVQGQSLGGNARNGHSAGCSVPNRGQGEGRMRTATAGSLCQVNSLPWTGASTSGARLRALLSPSRAAAGHPDPRPPEAQKGCMEIGRGGEHEPAHHPRITTRARPPASASPAGSGPPRDARASPSPHAPGPRLPQADKARRWAGRVVHRGALGPRRRPHRWAPYRVSVPGAGPDLPGDGCPGDAAGGSRSYASLPAAAPSPRGPEGRPAARSRRAGQRRRGAARGGARTAGRRGRGRGRGAGRGAGPGPAAPRAPSANSRSPSQAECRRARDRGELRGRRCKSSPTPAAPAGQVGCAPGAGSAAAAAGHRAACSPWP